MNMRVTRYTRTFTQSDYDRCAALTGDDNPIHVDPGFAATTRWGKTLAHGMLLYGVISGLLAERFPGSVQLEQKLKFPGPTFTGEEMTIELELLSSLGGIVEVASRISRPTGDLACEATTRLRLPEGGLAS